MISTSHMKILPVLIVVAFLAFSVRLADVATSGLPTMAGSAMAKAEPKPQPVEEKAEMEEEKPLKMAALDDEASSNEIEGEKPNIEKKAPKKESSATKWRDASDSDMDYTKIKMTMFDDLSKRKNELDSREKDLLTKEALLKAAEQELDRKYQEMNQLRKQIENLLEDQSEEEKRRIASLVKIYEGMKPKSAASIFNTLDLDVLVAVMSEMSERRLSPILAVMNPERARTVTIILAEQKKLPELPN